VAAIGVSREVKDAFIEAYRLQVDYIKDIVPPADLEVAKHDRSDYKKGQ
jgi:hypothetical protein